MKTGRFVWMDPDEPDRPHKCVTENAGDATVDGPAKRPTTSGGSAKKKRPKKASATTSKQSSAAPSKASSTPRSVDWLAPHRLPDDDDPPDDHVPVELDARGHLVFKSRLHAGRGPSRDDHLRRSRDHLSTRIR